jgi:NAD(P)H-dependent flavin oxidoreductase YrpB (nitropropane dioxygenase family)
MSEPLRGIMRRPVVVAPMAGGPTTAELVAAASAAGALGFLAAGYKTAAAMRAEMDAVEAAGLARTESTFSCPERQRRIGRQ